MGEPHRDAVLTPPGPGAQLRGAAGSLVAVLRNPSIRNLELGWTLGIAADWALLVVALLVAYDTGGPVLVGLVSLVRMLPAMLVNILVDPVRAAAPERVLVGVHLLRAMAGVVVAAGALAGVPWLVFGGLAVEAAAGALVRPTTMALLPAVAATPEELVSANVTSALGEAAGTFAGPLVAGLVVAAAGPAPAAGLAAAACLLGVVAASRVRVAAAARPGQPASRRTIPLVDGVRELAGRRPAAAVIVAFLAQVVVRGALTTFLAVLAIEVLGLGEGGVGLLGAAMGIGGLAGAFGALALGSSRWIAPAAMVALAAWGIPLAVIGVVPVPAVAFVMLAIVGTANAVLDVAGFTLLQRGIPNEARSAVFSVLEVVVAIGISGGALLGSALLAGPGVEVGLVVTGLALPVAAALAWPFARRLDAAAVVPEHRAALLRSVPLFCPLPLAGLERLATSMREVSFDAGEPLMTEGEPGETYLVIERGRVAVSAGGRPVREQGPGSGVGEIALLRTVPRTATVVAVEPVTAWAIEGGAFLAAVTGHDESAAQAAALVEERVGRDGRPVPDVEP